MSTEMKKDRFMMIARVFPDGDDNNYDDDDAKDRAFDREENMSHAPSIQHPASD